MILHSRRDRRSYISPEGRQHPSKYSADELHTLLVEDAVRSHATDLQWAVMAYKRIGRLRHGNEGRGSEVAFLAVLADVTELTGRTEMPLG